MSLKIFDRSFAVTYLLEAIAIAIGLSGVAATFSAQTLARAREFGMLRHVGVTRGQILRILALEGGSLTALGVACGFALGLLISLILVFVVNPQSFHWTMQLHLPWGLLASVAALLMVGVGADRAGVGTLCAVGRADSRSQGGLVMRFLLALMLLLAQCCQAAPPDFAPVAAGPGAGLPGRFRRPSRVQDRMVVRHRLAQYRRRQAARLPGHLLPQPHRRRRRQSERVRAEAADHGARRAVRSRRRPPGARPAQRARRLRPRLCEISASPT